MTSIELSRIKPSPQPIRLSWDEDKLEELKQSIKEQGLIVPIKVRPTFKPCPIHGVEYFTGDMDKVDELINCDGCTAMMNIPGDEDCSPTYEVVYGHRRLEACRRAGLDEIETIIDLGVDDTNALIQALIENVQREDITHLEEGCGYKSLRDDFGLKQKEIAQKVGKSNQWISRLIGLIDDPISDILHVHGDPGNVAEDLRRNFGDDIKTRSNIAQKAVDEGLARDQVKQVAESVAATKDPKRREALIDTPYSSFIHDPEINRERAEKYGASDPMSIPKDKTPGQEWQELPEVKAIIDWLKIATKKASEVGEMEQQGKFSPEAWEFIRRKINKMIYEWDVITNQKGE